MCNRYVSPTQSEIERFWHIGRHNSGNWITQVAPRRQGPFLRSAGQSNALELVVGQWGLIPWFAKEPKVRYATNNARFEELSQKASYKLPWRDGKRCLIPAWSFDEPCWETGKNVWWR